MNVAIVHEEILQGRPDSEDLLGQASLVTGALQALNFSHKIFTPGDSLTELYEFLGQMSEYSPTLVFNLVESHPRGQRLFPAFSGLLELAGFPYTGCPYDTLLTTTNKITAKSIMRACSIPTPGWHVFDGAVPPLRPHCHYIVKPSCEDASVGIDDTSIFTDRESLLKSLPEAYATHKQPLLIEEFITGRELNVSMLDHGNGKIEALPAAEIVFQDWPEDKPKIVNYAAKWLPRAFEYNNTPRQFNPPGIDTEYVKRIALSCWRAFGLRGYGRVDFRVDESARAYAIEVNANPCISHDSGYMAAAREAGYTETAVVNSIIEAALRK
ncbi:MAG: hypothetical protein HQL01_06630 [Nitrospirae bacterium]|nr:hypothetical protein [Nitrospirota bacterium]